jgi:hypothetical protein
MSLLTLCRLYRNYTADVVDIVVVGPLLLGRGLRLPGSIQSAYVQLVSSPSTHACHGRLTWQDSKHQQSC